MSTLAVAPDARRYAPEVAQGRLAALDGVRAGAVMAVVLAHIGWRMGHGGYLGVDIFFVLSGYLITRLLLNEQRAAGRVAFGRFYLRRALRLYPALTVCILGCAVAGTRLYESWWAWGRAALYSAFYVMDIARAASWSPDAQIGPLGVTWSLAIEEHFYLVWPVALVLLMRMRRGGRHRVFIAASAVASIAWVALILLSVAGLSRGALFFHPELRCAALFVGCAAACAPAPRRDGTLRVLVYASFATLLLLLQFSGSDSAFRTYLISMPLTWLATAVLIVGLTCLDAGAVGALLAWRPIAYVGRISYGIYLYHLPIITLIVEQHYRFAVRFTLSVVLPIAVAAISYHLIEQPFLRLKDRVAARPGVDAALTPVVN